MPPFVIYYHKWPDFAESVTVVCDLRTTIAAFRFRPEDPKDLITVRILLFNLVRTGERTLPNLKSLDL